MPGGGAGGGQAEARSIGQRVPGPGTRPAHSGHSLGRPTSHSLTLPGNKDAGESARGEGWEKEREKNRERDEWIIETLCAAIEKRALKTEVSQRRSKSSATGA